MVQPKVDRKKVAKAQADPKNQQYKAVDFYRDLRTWKMTAASESYWEEVAEKLMLWVQKEDAIHFSQFCLIQGIAESTLEKYAGKYPKLREAKDAATEIMAARREIGAVYSRIGNKPVNGNEISRYQGLHCKKYREFIAWKATLNQPAQIPPQQIVVIERIPSPDEPIKLEPTDE